MISTKHIREFDIQDVLPTRLVADPAHRFMAWFIYRDTDYRCEYVGDATYIVNEEGLELDDDDALRYHVGRLEGLFGFAPLMPWSVALFWMWTWFVTVSDSNTLATLALAVVTMIVCLATWAALDDITNVTVKVAANADEAE